MKTFFQLREETSSPAAAAAYHKKMADHHSKWAAAHDHESNNVGPRSQEKHSYAETNHSNAADMHKAAHAALKKHGLKSSEFKQAHNKANAESEMAHDSTSETSKKWNTAGKPKHETPKIENHG